MEALPMRPHRFWTDRLSEALDGTLAPEQARGLEDHLAGCPACRRVGDELEEVRRRARALPMSPPTADLWAGIAREIGASPKAEVEEGKVIPMHAVLPGRAAGPSPVAAPSRWALGPLPAGAAAVLLLVVGGMLGAGLGGTGGTPEPAPAGAEADREAQIRQAAGVTVEPSLFEELRTLEEALRVDLSRLDPETQTTILGNLETIDRAIRESVGALRADPESGYLRGHLGNALERKVGYLQSVTRLLES
jgi:hypothetical protein